MRISSPVLLAFALVLSLGGAVAQDQGSEGALVCDEQGLACSWQASPPISQYHDVLQGQEPGFASVDEPVRWMFSWQPAPAPSPLRVRRAPAPQCAGNIDEAKGRLQVGIGRQNASLLLSAYDWAGQSNAQATPVIDQLLAFEPGHWYERVVQGRLGGPLSDEDLRQPDRRLRFFALDGRLQGEFTAVEVMDCWFLRFASVSSDEDAIFEDQQVDPAFNSESVVEFRSSDGQSIIVIDPAPGSELPPTEWGGE